jgi:hypothetical protein
MVPLPMHIVVKGFRQHGYWNPTFFVNIDKHILTNDAQELTHCRLEFKWDRNRIRKNYLAMPRFECGSLG